VVTAPRAIVEHVVVRRDTLWDLAERYLGDGHRAAELFEANRGRAQPDDASLVDPGALRPGWVLSIPLDSPATVPVPGEVVVRRGDTLWGLATDHLGDGHRYGEVVELNAGHPQPGGGALVDPDVIEPGWVLRMPPASPGGTTGPTPADVPSASPPAASAPAVLVPPPASAGTTPTEGSPTVPDPQLVPEAAPAVGVAAPDPPERTTAEGDPAKGATAPVGLIGGGVATAGLVVLLDRLRRAQQRRRRAGRRLPQPSPQAAVAERVLRAGADVETATLIDVALRAAAAGTGPEGLPPLRRVEAGSDAVTVALDTDAPAPQGFSDDGQGRWRSAAALADLARLGAPAVSPSPCLVPVGRDDAGIEILLDVEEAGFVSVVGEPTTALALLRALAMSLATAPWSDQARTLLVGFESHDPAVSALVEATTSEVAVGEARRRMEAATAALTRLGCPSVAQARASGAAADSWSVPLVIVAAVADPNILALMDEVARCRGHGVCIVVAAGGEPSSIAGRVLRIEPEGAVRLDGVDRPLRSRQLDDADTRLVGDLLDTACADDVAPTEDSLPAPARIPRRPTVGKDALAEMLDGVDVLVRVLGPIEVVRRSPDGERRLEVGIQKSVEAIVYLALRETPADREELQAALWPAGTNSAKTFQNVVWAARKALGVDRDGADLLPDPVEGRYGLNQRLVSTYGLFHELVARADEEDDAQASAGLLAQALTLVQGEPFVGVGRNYAWVAPHAGMIVSQVVDAAEELAEVRLATGDWRGAEWAARQGLHSFPSDERLYRLLMRCAHAAGSVAGVQRVFQELLAAVADPDSGVEPIDTVHAETVALLEDLTSVSKVRPSPDWATA